MIPWSAHRSRLRRPSFRADRDGAAAVEFALVAMPFLALCGAIIQVALQIWAQQNFERNVQSASRGLLTGQFQNSNAGTTDPAILLANLKAALCGPGKLTVFRCADVKVNVATFASFGNSGAAAPVSGGGWSSNFASYTCARPGSIVVVTAAVPFPTFFSLLGLSMKSFADGSHLLMATKVFRTEPYEVPAGTAACGG